MEALTSIGTARARSDAVAGDGLLHPAALVAIGLLIVNDHLLKAAWPGFVTGKLSDFAGLLFFPLLLQAVVEVGGALAGRPSLGDRRVLVLAAVATGSVFATIKLVPEAALLYGSIAGHVQWLAAALPAMLVGDAAGWPSVARVAVDPNDLIALTMLPIAVWVGYGRARDERGTRAIAV